MITPEAGKGVVQKLHRGPLRERVYEQLKRLILTNQWSPGRQIVIDRLASDLGVSHTPVREALAMLELDGLVSSKHYRNPRVAGISASDVRDVYAMRLLLEGWAAPQAALALSDAKLAEVEQLLQQARRDAAHSLEAHLQADIAFHCMIAHSTGNSLFARLAQMVNDQSMRVRSLVEATRGPETIEGILDEHFGILAALQSRDPQLTRQRVNAHLEAAMQRTLVALEGISSQGLE